MGLFSTASTAIAPPQPTAEHLPAPSLVYSTKHPQNNSDIFSLQGLVVSDGTCIINHMKTKSTKLPVRVQRRIDAHNANQALVDKLVATFTEDESIGNNYADRAVYALGYLSGLMANMMGDATPAAKVVMVATLNDRIQYRNEKKVKQ